MMPFMLFLTTITFPVLVEDIPRHPQKPLCPKRARRAGTIQRQKDCAKENCPNSPSVKNRESLAEICGLFAEARRDSADTAGGVMLYRYFDISPGLRLVF
jgi:hypothetical protein